MRYYPLFLDIRDKDCVVIGGGEVAERKVLGLLGAGARVTVISPRVTKGLKKLADKKEIGHKKKGYKKGDLEGAFLAISASNSREVNATVHEEAVERKIPVNVVDDPVRCTFILPSVVDRGSLVIAVSTSGKSPALARRLREDLEKSLGAEYGAFADLLGAVRNKLLKNNVKGVKKERVINALVRSPLPELIKEGSTREINGVLKRLLGEGYTLKRLGISVGKRHGRM
ncbi:MAG TPA: bifunctional precorrin-2 dehydrogenase/sirohydrochlorin ferrochelatase [Thermodesulfobacteriota bacterium]|nr:bifunctional precorrin-2 dehydrogenase/sirohydrochlorin ferrochelatase [Thermodesulfobacteriota bacterium]